MPLKLSTSPPLYIRTTMKKICFPAILNLFATLCLAVTPVYAQNTSLSLSPPVVEILISPNKQVTQTFNLSYQGSNVLLIPDLHLIKPSDNNGHVIIEPKPLDPARLPLVIKSSHPLGEPMTITQPGKLPLTLTLEAPTTDKASDVYLALVVRAVSADDLWTASTTSPAISSLILLTINPTSVFPIALNIENFDLPIIHDSWFPLSLEPEIVNKTNLMIRPEGNFTILGPSGKSLVESSLYPNLILGESSRVVRGLSGQQPEPLNWQPAWTNLGPYRFRLTINTQGGSKLVESEKTVWILPLRASALGLLFTSLVCFNFYYYGKRKKSKTSA